MWIYIDTLIFVCIRVYVWSMHVYEYVSVQINMYVRVCVCVCICVFVRGYLCPFIPCNISLHDQCTPDSLC